jgi:pectate lyase
VQFTINLETPEDIVRNNLHATATHHGRKNSGCGQWWWCAVVGLLSVASSAGGPPAFSGAEGFGAQARGGRDGAVIEVTSLDDRGPGTLRAACEAAGPRTVVFRVGGTIRVETPIVVTHPYLTVAGQTAPGDGILIRKAKSRVPLAPLCIRTHDVVMRCLRIRTGDSPDGTESDCLDISCEDDTDTVHDIILDHCSFSWSTDESLAIMGRYLGGGDNTQAVNWKPNNTATRNITVQWCIISAALLTPQIKKSRGALIKFIGDCSFHHNLMAHNSSRNPRLQGQRDSLKDVVNTVVYNSPQYGATPSDGV